MKKTRMNGNGSVVRRRSLVEDVSLALPAVDHLFLDEDGGAYSVGFLPSDEVSREEKEFVEVPVASPAGSVIAEALALISSTLPGTFDVARAVHLGGSGYKFFAPDDTPFDLDDADVDTSSARRILDALHRAAVAAQEVYAAEIIATA